MLWNAIRPVQLSHVVSWQILNKQKISRQMDVGPLVVNFGPDFLWNLDSQTMVSYRSLISTIGLSRTVWPLSASGTVVRAEMSTDASYMSKSGTRATIFVVIQNVVLKTGVPQKWGIWTDEILSFSCVLDDVWNFVPKTEKNDADICDNVQVTNCFLYKWQKTKLLQCITWEPVNIFQQGL